MAILASGHKLVKCGIDGAISGVVTDETLSGNGTTAEPLGALLENVIFDDSITESSTDLGVVIGVNPLWVNYVVTGGGSSGGDPQVNYIVHTYSGNWNDTTNVVQSNSSTWGQGGSGDVEVNNFVYDNSATINEVNSAYQNNSANYLTAHQSLEGYATENWVTAQGYITGVDLSNYYTKNETSSKSEINNALTSITPGDTSVNLYVQSNSANINEVNSTVNSNSSKWNEISVYETNSGTYLTAHQSISSKLDVTAFDGWSATHAYDISAGNGIDLYIDNVNRITRIDITASGNTEVNTYVQNNSATINNVNTTYQTNSGNYLTAHQDISNKFDTSSFTAWSAAQAANAFKLSAGNGVNLIDDAINKITRIDVTAAGGDADVNSYVQNNSAGINNAISTYQTNSANYLTAISIPESSTWNDVATTYQTNSSTYLTAHQDISNKLDITAFTSWSATQEANDYELSAGNGITLYDDAVNKITRIDANGGSNFRTVYAKNEPQNSAVLGYYFLENNATDIQGIVQFVPDTSGTYSVCPFTDINSNAYYTELGYQSTNSPTVQSGDLVTLPFHFFADGQYVCPTTVGIKGSDVNANITPYNIIINYK